MLSPGLFLKEVDAGFCEDMQTAEYFLVDKSTDKCYDSFNHHHSPSSVINSFSALTRGPSQIHNLSFQTSLHSIYLLT
ncbi:hypothetical protein D5086_024255 [Populus alba]|uniref:Uncharacterized protein n=1 Tax=Populus alba TaxID=43335 RepID=A0ACC4B4Y6_POPAL